MNQVSESNGVRWFLWYWLQFAIRNPVWFVVSARSVRFVPGGVWWTGSSVTACKKLMVAHRFAMDGGWKIFTKPYPNWIATCVSRFCTVRLWYGGECFRLQWKSARIVTWTRFDVLVHCSVFPFFFSLFLYHFDTENFMHWYNARLHHRRHRRLSVLLEQASARARTFWHANNQVYSTFSISTFKISPV